MPIKKKILVVDDDETVRSLLCEFLAAEGFGARAVGSGESALALLRKRHFGAVIADYEMPGMNGAELISEIRSRNPYLFIIGISASGSGSARYFMRVGADFFFSKPFQLEDVLLALKIHFWPSSQILTDETLRRGI